MFSSLIRRLGTRFLDHLDLMVELSTLGEYGVDRGGAFALEPGGAPRPCIESIAALDSAGESILAVDPTSGPTSSDSARPRLLARSRGDCPRGARVSLSCRDAATRP